MKSNGSYTELEIDPAMLPAAITTCLYSGKFSTRKLKSVGKIDHGNNLEILIIIILTGAKERTGLH